MSRRDPPRTQRQKSHHDSFSFLFSHSASFKPFLTTLPPQTFKGDPRRGGRGEKNNRFLSRPSQKAILMYTKKGGLEKEEEERKSLLDSLTKGHSFFFANQGMDLNLEINRGAMRKGRGETVGRREYNFFQYFS